MSAQAAENKKEKHYLTIVAGIVIALIFLFYMFTFSVPIGRLAVKTEFGKPKTPITRPGLYFKIPVVNNVRHFDAKIQISEDRFEETMTRDQQTVIVMAYILWKIDKPLRFLNAVGTLEEALFWVSGGKHYRIEETFCVAKGDPTCTIIINKHPIE